MIFARRLLDLPFLVILLGLASICMAVPAAYAVVLGNFPVARAFFYSGSVLFVVTTMVALATATRCFADAPRNQIASVVATYLLLPFVLAIPVHQAMPGLPFQNAWFEMLSCFSTTGATLFDAPDLVDNPIHLWRAMVGWLGGFYGLLIAAAILAPMALGGIDLLAGRMPGKIGGGSGDGENTSEGAISGRSSMQTASNQTRFSPPLSPIPSALTMARKNTVACFAWATKTICISGRLTAALPS